MPLTQILPFCYFIVKNYQLFSLEQCNYPEKYQFSELLGLHGFQATISIMLDVSTHYKAINNM